MFTSVHCSHVAGTLDAAPAGFASPASDVSQSCIVQRGKLEMEQLFREVVPEEHRFGTRVRRRIAVCHLQPLGLLSDMPFSCLELWTANACLPLFPLLQFVFRQGSPLDPAALRMVAALDAQRVIVCGDYR